MAPELRTTRLGLRKRIPQPEEQRDWSVGDWNSTSCGGVVLVSIAQKRPKVLRAKATGRVGSP